jgi:hypothetical protein
VAIEDQETGEILEIDTSKQKFWDNCIRNQKRDNEILQERPKGSKIDRLCVRTDGNYLRALDQFLK